MGRDAGTLAVDHYASQMAGWRSSIRCNLLRVIQWETQKLAYLQCKVRCPLLDSYFALTANAGTHTFYMVILPVFFWFSNPVFGDDVVWVLALGVYLTGILKDLLCLPRPLSPPLHRISMSGSAPLEYGFPSTHSANAVSVALLVLEAYSGWPVHVATGLALTTLILGRLYTGMHGFLDVLIGSSVGYLVWVLRSAVRTYTEHTTPAVALVVTMTCLIAIAVVPEPVDDCPCFDDSVAFLGVLLGLVWMHTGECSMPKLPDTPWKPLRGMLRFVVGVSCVVAWRISAKRILLRVLPPLWRILNRLGVEHPRRYFVPAPRNTRLEPKNIPDDSIPDSREQLVKAYRRIRHGRMPSDEVGPQSAVDVYAALAAGRVADTTALKHIHKPRVRYDVEVVMRIIVYSGIPLMAVTVLRRIVGTLGI